MAERSNSIMLALRMPDGRSIGRVKVRELRHYARESGQIARLCVRVLERNAVSLDKRVDEVETADSLAGLLDTIKRESADA